jgi:hypothetical protein
MKKFLASLSSTLIAFQLLLVPSVAFAQPTNPFDKGIDEVKNVGKEAGITNTDRSLPEIIGQLINIVLGFLGIVLLGLILWAGFLWMTAGGNVDQTKAARAYMANAVIGLIIVVAAFAITNFVLTSLVNVTTQ